jgi:hypothetical protein
MIVLMPGMTPIRPALWVSTVACVFIFAANTQAQAPADGGQRIWFELGLGGSRQDPNCTACAQQSAVGGISATIAAGLTITPRFGIAVLGRKFDEFSFETSHDATYVIGLAQLAPAPQRFIVFNLGIGSGIQHGDNPPYGDNGRGTVVAGGLALRVPSSSTFGLTLTADLIKSMTGALRTVSGRPSSSYRPVLLTIGLGLNISGETSRRPPHSNQSLSPNG